MPDQITVSEFVAETNEDYKSPTASNFTTRMSHCRNTVAALEEVSERSTSLGAFGDFNSFAWWSNEPPPSGGSVYVPLFITIFFFLPLFGIILIHSVNEL